VPEAEKQNNQNISIRYVELGGWCRQKNPYLKVKKLPVDSKGRQGKTADQTGTIKTPLGHINKYEIK
jgi:hypothetical protein